MGKNIEKYVNEEAMQIANKYMKRCPISLASKNA